MNTDHKKLWVVVANASGGRLFRAADAGGGLVEFETLAHPAGRLSNRELTSDSPGGAFDPSRGGLHETGTVQEPKRHELEEFAIQIARRLAEGRTRGEFDTLALIAAPALLGELRAHLDAPTRALIAHTVDKNLVHAALPEIIGALPATLLRRS